METCIIKPLINRSGGTASKNATICRVTIPASWAKEMNITKETLLSMTYEDQTITIKKQEE